MQPHALEHPSHSRPAAGITGPLLSVATVALLFLGGELALRAYQFVRSSNVPYVLDQRLGWRAAKCRIRIRDATGDRAAGWMSQDQNGFRQFGDVSTHKVRVFVIGDSYTMANDVPDGEAYFSVLGDRDVNVFAYGCGGYGSLQEYMILDEFFDRIRPDVVVWQFCSNDFINNSAELESESTQNNNGMVRPYYENGRIHYTLPSRFGAIRGFALQHSRLLYSSSADSTVFERPCRG